MLIAVALAGCAAGPDFQRPDAPTTTSNYTATPLTPTTEADQQRLVAGMDLKFLNETPQRVPMTDWYATESPKKVGFQARSVVGGVFIKTLAGVMAK